MEVDGHKKDGLKNWAVINQTDEEKIMTTGGPEI